MNRTVLRPFTSCVLVAAVAFSTNLSAQTHVVNPAELRQEVLAATGSRQHNLEAVNSFLSSPKVREALGSTGINLAQAQTAVSSLDDQELARLAARSEKAQADFAAGRIGDHDLLLILLGFVALILVIIAVR
jgi:hypothetical protein